jgi:hypothetical protein
MLQQMLYGAKMLSRTLYVSCRKERVAQIARTNNYLFLQPKNLEFLLEMNMALRAKHRSSVLQSAFMVPKFRAFCWRYSYNLFVVRYFTITLC